MDENKAGNYKCNICNTGFNNGGTMLVAENKRAKKRKVQLQLQAEYKAWEVEFGPESTPASDCDDSGEK